MAATPERPHRLEQVRAAEDVHLQRLDRQGERAADQRLRGEVEDVVGLDLGHDGRELRAVAQVAAPVGGKDSRREERIQTAARFGVEGQPVDRRTSLGEPEGQPRALEPGVSGDKNLAPLE